MLVCGKIAKDFEEGKKLLMQNIENGKGLAKLKEFVAAQGGDASYVDDVEKLPKAKYVVEVKSEEEGFVSKIHAEEFGLIAMELGAGRATKESEIDLAVGIVLNKKRGDKVNKGDVLAYIHSNDENNIAKTSKKIKENFVITEKFENNIPLIYDIVK